MADNIVGAKKRSGMSFDRAYNLRENAKMRLLDIFSSAVCFKLTHDELCDRVRTQVLVPMKEKRAPHWVASYIQGAYDTKMAEVYRHHIMWVLSCDGVLMTNKQVDALTEKEANDIYTAFVERCCKKPGEKFGRDHLTKEEFLRNPARFTPSDYKSPWSRIDNDKSRHVWIDRDGTILYDKPFDSRFKNEVRVVKPGTGTDMGIGAALEG